MIFAPCGRPAPRKIPRLKYLKYPPARFQRAEIVREAMIGDDCANGHDGVDDVDDDDDGDDDVGDAE